MPKIVNVVSLSLTATRSKDACYLFLRMRQRILQEFQVPNRGWCHNFNAFTCQGLICSVCRRNDWKGDGGRTRDIRTLVKYWSLSEARMVCCFTFHMKPTRSCKLTQCAHMRMRHRIVDQNKYDQANKAAHPPSVSIWNVFSNDYTCAYVLYAARSRRLEHEEIESMTPDGKSAQEWVRFSTGIKRCRHRLSVQTRSMKLCW